MIVEWCSQNSMVCLCLYLPIQSATCAISVHHH